LPKTVTRQRRGCDFNPGPSAPESSTLTTRLPSHPWGGQGGQSPGIPECSGPQEEGGDRVRKGEGELDFDICPGATEFLVTPLNMSSRQLSVEVCEGKTGTFTVTSEHIRFSFLVFLFHTF